MALARGAPHRPRDSSEAAVLARASERKDAVLTQLASACGLLSSTGVTRVPVSGVALPAA